MSSVKSKQYQKGKKYIRKKQNKKAWMSLALISIFLVSILASIIITIVLNP